jgi:hypothetical protein
MEWKRRKYDGQITGPRRNKPLQGETVRLPRAIMPKAVPTRMVAMVTTTGTRTARRKVMAREVP